MVKLMCSMRKTNYYSRNEFELTLNCISEEKQQHYVNKDVLFYFYKLRGLGQSQIERQQSTEKPVHKFLEFAIKTNYFTF